MIKSPTRRMTPVTQQLPEVNPIPVNGDGFTRSHRSGFRTRLLRSTRDALRWTEADVRAWAAWSAIGSLMVVVAGLVLTAANGPAVTATTVVPGPTVVVTVTAPPTQPTTPEPEPVRTAPPPARPRVVAPAPTAPESAPSSPLSPDPTPAGTSGPPDPSAATTAPASEIPDTSSSTAPPDDQTSRPPTSTSAAPTGG